jgi:hypothetical protein
MEMDKADQLCRRISNISGRAWAKNWHTFISNFDDEILQWNERVPKKNCEGFSMFFVISCV